MRPSFPALTGLRFLAALHVVVYHAMRPALVDVTDSASDAGSRLLASGPTAVTLFFVLSGFILTIVYGGAPIQPRPFFVARLARVAPVYWLALLLALPIGAIARARGLVTDPLGALSFVLVAAGLQAWVPEAALRWNPPAWSLSCELFFYGLFPLLAAALLRMSRAASTVAASAAWAVGLALPIAYLALAPDGIASPRIVDDATWLNAVKLHPLARLPDFIVGLVAGRAFLDGARAPSWFGAGALIASVSLAASPLVPGLVLHNGLLAPLFAVVIVWLAAGTGPLAALLSSRPLVVLGEASYALYLLHVPVMMWVMAVRREATLPGGVALAACLATIPLSIVVERWLERPLRARIRARFTQP